MRETLSVGSHAGKCSVVSLIICEDSKWAAADRSAISSGLPTSLDMLSDTA
jgi:hypothetical protein